MAAASELPISVRKRDGRLVTFEADKISQALFAVTEELDRPSAFLARELTDAVLHFLAGEVETPEPTTVQIAETVVKVVRELGQPDVAAAFARKQELRHQQVKTSGDDKAARQMGHVAFAPSAGVDDVLRSCARTYCLQAVFSRDLAAAHEEGLIALGGLEQPAEIGSLVVDTRPAANGWLDWLDAPARILVFDSPEYALAEETVPAWARSLARFCEQTKRDAIVNLHMAAPPPWARAAAKGPLFAGAESSSSSDYHGTQLRILKELAALASPNVQIRWHIGGETDLDQWAAPLDQIGRRVGSRLCFVFDRAKRSPLLGRGLDRERQATLLDVGLNLTHFAQMLDHDAELFLLKLASLARMAVRAGVQKRAYLRRLGGASPILAQGFLLERARLVVVPEGLAAVVERFLDQPIWASKRSLDMAKRIVSTLCETFMEETRSTNLEVAVDASIELPGASQAWLHAAGSLHGVTGAGALTVRDTPVSELLPLLPYAWKKTAILGLCGPAICSPAATNS